MAFTRVQTKTRIGPGQGDPFTVAMTSSVVAGNTLLVTVNSNDSSNYLNGITDNLGNTYTKIDESATSSGWVQLWYAIITTGGSCTLSLDPQSNWSGATNVDEYSGISAVRPLDQQGTATGSSTSSATVGPTSTTRSASELVYVVGAIGPLASFDFSTDGTITAGSGYSDLHTTSNLLYIESKTIASAAAQTGVFTITPPTGGFFSTPDFNLIIATFADTDWAKKTKTHTTNSLLRRTVSKVHTTNAFTYKRFTRSHTTNSQILKIGNFVSHSTDSLLKSVRSRTHTANALIYKRLLKTHTTNSLRYKRSTITHTLNALKYKRLTRTHTSDAYILNVAYGIPLKPDTAYQSNTDPVTSYSSVSDPATSYTTPAKPTTVY